MKHGIVGRIDDGIFQYQGWPTVCKDENGVLYAACSGFRLGHVCPLGKNVMYISRDEGKTWSSPIVVNDTVMDDRDAGILCMGQGKMLLSWFSHPMSFYEDRRGKFSHWVQKEKALFTDAAMTYWTVARDKERYGSFVKLSEDGGFTWGETVQVPATSPHGPIQLHDGRLIWIGREFHSGEYPKDATLVLASCDGGKSWDCISQIPFPQEYEGALFCEPDVAELPDGTLMGAIRAQGEPVPFKFTVFTTFSADGGRTWTMPECLGISGSPPHLLVHSSGKVILTYARRQKPCRIAARISEDNGRTFGEEIELHASADPDIGYPSTVELSDGSMLTAYYQTYGDDQFTSILYTKWSLDEIL